MPKQHVDNRRLSCLKRIDFRKRWLALASNFRSIAPSLGSLLRRFRAADKLLRYKIVVIIAWLSLAGASAIVALPPSRSNQLSARVSVQDIETLDSKITAICIENAGSRDWGDTFLKLNGAFSHALPDMKSGSRAILTLDKFSGPDGKAPPNELEPQRLKITCKRGEVDIDFKTIAR